MPTQPAEPPKPVSRRSMAIAAFSTVVEWYDFTLYLYLATVLSRVVVLAGVAGGVSAVGAVGAVATAEQFPGEGRLTGLALGATTATAIFGGLAPWAAQALTERSCFATAPGAMIAVVGICVLPVVWRMAETAPSASRISPCAKRQTS